MPDMIFGNRFYGYREPAWHGLGNVFQEELHDAQVAIAGANANFLVGKRQLFYVGEMGLLVPTERFALVREELQDDPVERVFGVVGAGYEIVQNTQFGAIIQPLADIWPIETVGVLDYGERLFFVLDMGMLDLGHGEQIHEYLFGSDTKTGGEALSLSITPVRVVCGNTWITGLSQALVTVKLSHYHNAGAELAERVGLIAKTQKARADVLTAVKSTMRAKLVPERSEELLLKLYPDAKPRPIMGLAQLAEQGVEIGDTLEAVMEAAERKQESLTERFRAWRGAAGELFEKFGDEQPALAETPYALWQAIVELEDYRKTSSKQDETTACRNALFGDRAAKKAQAFQLCLVASKD